MRTEPALSVHAALVSPSTGILDAHAYMLALRGDIEDHGGAIAFGATLDRAELTPDGFLLHVGTMKLKCRALINSAGLSAPALARRIEGLDAAHVPRESFAKGSYFTLAGHAPFERLIYPVPEPGGLGIDRKGVG